MMKRIHWLPVILLLSLGNELSAAWVVTYSMTPSVPGWSQIFGTAGNNVIPEPAACSDQITSSVITLPFTFQFDGTNYSTYQITDNGCLIFGGGAVPTCGNPEFNSQIPNNLADAGTMYRPFLAPLWDELWYKPVSAFGQGSWKVTGSTPNRLYTIEWLFMSWRGAGTHTTDDISFQVVLHETSMVIDFIYHNGAGVLNIPTASCGLGAIANATYYSLNNLTGAPAVSSTVATNGLAAKPTNDGQMYRWTPSTVLPISLLSFTGYASGNENVINWSTATQTNNHFFTLLRTDDGTDFSEVARVDGAGTTMEPMDYSVIDHDPFPGMTYYMLRWTDFNGHSEVSPFISVSSSSVVPVKPFPDPASSLVNIGTLDERTEFSIYTSEGQLVRKGEMEKGESVIDVSEMDNGIYFILLGEERYRIIVDHNW